MKRQPIWRVEVRVGQEVEEAMVEFLSARFGTPASSFYHLERQVSTVSVFLTDRSLWTPASRRTILDEFARLESFGLAPGPMRISFGRVRAEDWAESWKKHFPPLRVGGRLLIRPSWSREKALKGQSVIVLDPGLSFGTGQHPTTSFCLSQICRHRKAGTKQSLLDIGTGSGILAIAAAKLGYEPVVAFDFDPESIIVADANARRNANLTANLLREHLDRMLACLVPGGVLVLAGILAIEFDDLSALCVKAGLKPLAARTLREWRSGSFLKVVPGVKSKT
ncbi:MAG: 50S ribosomal protein L11 methyltransferase [Verrucomicrobia bacterium]|nr:50S ribosomal protein L11 methyltransferase [Verrucomicrobiota bacterium]